MQKQCVSLTLSVALALCATVTASAGAQPLPFEPDVPELAALPPTPTDMATWRAALDVPAATAATVSAAAQQHRLAVLNARPDSADAQVEAWCSLAADTVDNPYLATAELACGRWLVPVAAKAAEPDPGVRAYSWLRLRAVMGGNTQELRQALALQFQAWPGLHPAWRRWFERRSLASPWPGPYLAAAEVSEMPGAPRWQLERFLEHVGSRDDEAVAELQASMRKRCANAEPEACVQLAHLEVVFTERLVAREEVAAMRAKGYASLTSLCRKQVLNACASLVRLGRDRSEHHLEPLEALNQLVQLCDWGHAASCANAGLMMARGTLVPLDEDRAKVLFRKACRLGSPQGCTGVSYYLHRGAHRNVKAALLLAAVACRLGEPMGCAHLSNAYATGEGLVADLRRAIDFAMAACKPDTANRFSCRFVAAAVATGQAHLSAQDAARYTPNGLWADLDLGACQRTPSRPCAMHAAVAAVRAKTAAERTEAVDQLARACAEPWPPACHWRDAVANLPALP